MATLMSLSICISGLGSGTDPDPGIGVAACIRDAFPDAEIIGRDYSYRAAGIHLPMFDRVIVRRPWNEISLEDLKQEYALDLDQKRNVISTIDLEVLWLTRTFGTMAGLLVPPTRAFAACVKPLSGIVTTLGFSIPESLPLEMPDRVIHAFLRRHGPRTWIKGAYHQALRVPSWEALQPAIAEIRRQGATGLLHLQKDVLGQHESLAFSAYQGSMLDAIWITKHEMTRDGKTLSGTPRSIPEETKQRLCSFITETGWHGGGEIELIRDPASGRVSVIDINPRFPAWIHGAAILGTNLPASLVTAATGIQGLEPHAYKGFVRVHTTVPLRGNGRPVPPLVLEPDDQLDTNKHGTSLRQISERIEHAMGLPRPDLKEFYSSTPAVSVPTNTWSGGEPELDRVVFTGLTPALLVLEAATKARFEQLAQWQGPRDGLVGRIAAYSVKTNPDHRFLKAAREHGLSAEVISVQELAAARTAGFPSERIIFNGPGKALIEKALLLDDRGCGAVAMYGVDSVEELERLLWLDLPASFFETTIIALRFRPARVSSRFGIPLDLLDVRKRLVEQIRRFPACSRFGVHIHVSGAIIGRNRWRMLMLSQVEHMKTFCNLTGRNFVSFNAGGGGYPEDLDDDLTWLDYEFLPQLQDSVPTISYLVIEPGRAAVQDLVVLVTRVIEVRMTGQGRDVIVDASIAEVPEAEHFPHRIMVKSDNGWVEALQLGNNRILGRTCMEADILASRLELPADMQSGDRIIIMDVGAYDRSMSYDFARG